MPAPRVGRVPSLLGRSRLSLALQTLRRRGGHPAPPEAETHSRGRGRRCVRDLRLRPLHVQSPLSPRRAEAKSFAISVATGKSLAKFRAEAEKCVLVCANCH